MKSTRKSAASFLWTHLDTTTGARAVPARSTSLGRGGPENSRVFTPDEPLRTGTVRGPAVAVSRCARALFSEECFHPDMRIGRTQVFRFRGSVWEATSLPLQANSIRRWAGRITLSSGLWRYENSYASDVN